jgi:hypothetical protein
MPSAIVLVHGAFAESASWDRVIDPLLSAGHPVIAAANPLRGLAADAASVSNQVRAGGRARPARRAFLRLRCDLERRRRRRLRAEHVQLNIAKTPASTATAAIVPEVPLRAVE